MDEIPSTPLVLVHCGWPGDRELARRALGEMGVECRFADGAAELRALIAGGRLDLVLADASGGHGPLGELLATLDADPEARDLPIVVLADSLDAPLLGDEVARRFHATLLAKPVARSQFQAAVRAGLSYWAGRRENRRLMAESEAARAEAEAARRRFLDLVQGLDSVAWEADADDGRVTFISRRAEDLLGYPADRWLGEPGPWPDIIHPDDREYVRAAREGGLGAGRNFELEYRAVAADGRILWLREAVRLTRDARGRPTGLRGLAGDITRRKKVERKLYHAKREVAEQLEDIGYLHELSIRLSATAELTPTLEEILAAVMGVVGAETGLMRLHHRERDDLEVATSTGLPTAYLERFGRVRLGICACGMAAARGGPVFIEDAEADPDDAPSREAARLGDFRAEYSTPLVSRSGEILGTIATFFREPHRPPERQVRLVELYARQAADIVEAARLHRDLREADRRKDEFLAELAHELRNPLAATLAAAHALRPGQGDVAALEETRDVVVRQVGLMNRLVEDLLDASRIRRGAIEIRLEPVELAGAVARAVEAARPLIDARRHELSVVLPEGPVWLEVDPVRLVQVLANLLTNAAKYTEPGGRIALTAGLQADGSLVVKVRDSGVGIAPEMLPRVFDLFAQADRSRGGLGLGLALVRSLVELHGGTVTAASEGPGRGSEFALLLPPGKTKADGRPAGADPAGSPPPAPAPARRRVLVVDDQPDLARSLARLLKGWGHEVDVAPDGPAALEAATARRPEVAILDVGLPGMDGHEVARRLRGLYPEGLRIVALTGYGQEEDRLRSRAAGFEHHLVKPVDPDELRRLIGLG